MENAFVRNAENGKFFGDNPIIFQSLPRIEEFIWFGGDAYIVRFVSHTWNNNQPIIVLDVISANAGQAPELFVMTNP